MTPLAAERLFWLLLLASVSRTAVAMLGTDEFECTVATGTVARRTVAGILA